jgi:membrane carboxypeptidase/penicillin-binding protein
MNYKKDIIDSIPVTNSLPPKGLSIVKIDKKSGKIANDQSKNPIFEYFLEENLPN